MKLLGQDKTFGTMDDSSPKQLVLLATYQTGERSGILVKRYTADEECDWQVDEEGYGLVHLRFETMESADWLVRNIERIGYDC